MEAVWEKFSPNIKKQAVKTDGIWSVEDPQFSEWAKLLQFKPAQAWNQWIVANKGTTVTLMVYEYGMAIATAKDRDDFMKACVLPETDRAGATAESSLREVVEALRQKWRNTFQASSIVWPEPRFEEHLNGVVQSSSVALDCVRASIGDCQQLRRYLEPAGRYLDDPEQRLVAREAIIEGIIRDLVPPFPSMIIDPMPLIENIEDTEHAEYEPPYSSKFSIISQV
ncbi:hypothetical protein F442_12179 [Phytophthora nicotianae P10297]|uniref:Uncharacterized protein n=1 Tax=Phytophthora nicotianae P10297 TaxID=1317064 RepID=W2YZN9_PHYNI|nr:hypothetical protein F442_12179 [Phytophthora nicotianae P10297]